MLLKGEVMRMRQAQEEIGRLAQNKLNLVTTGFILICLMTLKKKQKYLSFLHIQFALLLQHPSYSVLLLLSHARKNIILD